MGIAAFHLFEQRAIDIPLERKQHLHDRHLRLGHQPADDRLVGCERLGVIRVDVVVGREVDEDEVGLPGEHIAIEPEDAKLRARAADRGIVKREPGQRIFFREPRGDPRAVGGIVLVGGVGAPRKRRAVEHDRQPVAGPRAGVERGERRRRGGGRNGGRDGDDGRPGGETKTKADAGGLT